MCYLKVTFQRYIHTFVLIRVTPLTILGVHKNFIQSPLHF